MSTGQPQKRRGIRSAHGSQTILGGNDLEMHEKTRPPSAHSRNAWSDGGGDDEIDFSPRTPASAAVDLPSAMEHEPVHHQSRVTADVRAPGTKNVPVGCWTRFKRIIRGTCDFAVLKSRQYFLLLYRISQNPLVSNPLRHKHPDDLTIVSSGNFLRFSYFTFYPTGSNCGQIRKIFHVVFFSFLAEDAEQKV